MTPKARRFADFREPVIKRELSVEEPIERVVMRLFSGSPDGIRVLGWMLSRTAAVTPRNTPECALREAEGARRFIAEIHETVQGSHAPHSGS